VVDVPERIRTTHKFENQLATYEGSLDVGANFRVFFEWFKDQEDQEKDSVPGDPALPIGIVRAAISQFTGFTGVRIKRRPVTQMVLSKNGQETPVAQLSDGEKIYLSLVADLARRVGMAVPGSIDASEATGIVLIDEVELHLHPKWQREIILRLAEVFPKIQFLVTTHSPQVVGESARDRTWLVQNNQPSQVLFPVELAFGASSDLILEAVMGATDRDGTTKEAIRRLYDQMPQRDWESIRAGINALEQNIPGDPEITRLRATLKRHEVLGR
jgi:predicted ATP-binding protein involved in virulence